MVTLYRSDTPPKYREREITKRALQLHLEGMTIEDLRQIVELDARKAKTPGGLLATFLDRHQWRAALDEQRMKASAAESRSRRPPPDADEMPPLFAASVASELLRRQQTS